MDVTDDWLTALRMLQQQEQSSATATRTQARWAGRGRGGYSTVAEAVGGSRWRTPLTPFMQQATELNYSIREMHTFLLQHFLDYIDVHHCLPSKRSTMTTDEKELIDLEVTAFMTACAAGVDALKAILQRERLRRAEQEATAARAIEESEQEVLDEVGVGGELKAGSRPAHENAAVTFLFERLKAVTEVAETMQTERHRKTAASKTRFYGGPAETRRKVDTSTTAADNAGVDAQAASRDTPPKEDVWKRTPQELREELLLEQSLPAAYGGSGADIGFGGGEAEDSKWRLPGTHSAMTALASSERLTARINSISTPTSSSGKAVEVPATAAASRADTPGARTPSSKVSGAAAVSVGSGYKEASPFGAEKKRRQEAERPGVLAGATNTMKSWVGKADETSVGTAGAGDGGTGNNSLKLSQVLEGENRDLVARFKNELDDARLVESKMSEISGLMGLFASKVVEQQGGMEHVFDVAVSANDKLVRGGQHLEKAAKRGGAFRLFYAWFMMGASFCLLFLHFYNP